MTHELSGDIWVYLASSPLLGLNITLLAYLIAVVIQQQFNNHPLANTVLVATVIIGLTLYGLQISYQEYFSGAQFIHFLLGPVTVALALPLYRQLESMKRYLLPATLAISIGIVCGSITVLFVSRWLGADIEVQISLAVRAVTAPVAMSIAEQLGGTPTLAVLMVLFTGMFGAIFADKLLQLCGISDDKIIAIAIGNNSHGIGTARAFSIHQKKGAYAALAMALAVILNSLLLPVIILSFMA